MRSAVSSGISLDPLEGLALQVVLEHAAPELAPEPAHLAHPHRAQDLQQLIVPGGGQVPEAPHAPLRRHALERDPRRIAVAALAVEASLQRDPERRVKRDGVDAANDRLCDVLGEHDPPAPDERDLLAHPCLDQAPVRPGSTTSASAGTRTQTRLSGKRRSTSSNAPGSHPSRAIIAGGSDRWSRRGKVERSTSGTTWGPASEDPIGMTASVSSSRAASARIGCTAVAPGGGGSKRKGSCRTRSRGSGSVSTAEPSSARRRTAGFSPTSTDVEMNSRPWMPSRVGRTISDMSSHIPSQPRPPKGPR